MCKVIKVVPENHDINSLYLEVSDDKFNHRKAGQFASLTIMRTDGYSEPHSFSISGAPEESNLRLTIKNVGKFTSLIPDLKPGTSLICKGPFGAFCKDIDIKPSVVLLAGGVGIAPFLSVLRHFRNIKAGNKVVLFWVNKSMEEVFSSDEIDAMTNELSLKVIYCLSREDDIQKYSRSNYPEVFYEKGRLSSDVLVKYGITGNAAFYLCGPLPMMESALMELGKLDVDAAAVQQERFTWNK
ncbi:MAG: FAD-binding oxidoreductase [Smithella sp.]|jgi:predicted ferric reductase